MSRTKDGAGARAIDYRVAVSDGDHREAERWLSEGGHAGGLNGFAGPLPKIPSFSTRRPRRGTPLWLALTIIGAAFTIIFLMLAKN
ncbi:MAG: hypothetical protein GC199_05300 [Alphaproteobacteria bacterium]|nr:hypothetical protein [Alphaproteobacteria bacterium]